MFTRPYNTGSYNMSCLTVNFSGRETGRKAALIFRANVKSNIFRRNEKLLRGTRFTIYFSHLRATNANNDPPKDPLVCR